MAARDIERLQAQLAHVKQFELKSKLGDILADQQAAEAKAQSKVQQQVAKLAEGQAKQKLQEAVKQKAYKERISTTA